MNIPLRYSLQHMSILDKYCRFLGIMHHLCSDPADPKVASGIIMNQQLKPQFAWAGSTPLEMTYHGLSCKPGSSRSIVPL